MSKHDKKIKELSINSEKIKKIYDEKIKEFEQNLKSYYLINQNNKNLKEKICMMIKKEK